MKENKIVNIVLVLMGFVPFCFGDMKDFSVYDSKYHYTDQWANYNGYVYKKTSRLFGKRYVKDGGAVDLFFVTQAELQTTSNWDRVSGVWYRNYVWDHAKRRVPSDTKINLFKVADNLSNLSRGLYMVSNKNDGNTMGRYSSVSWRAGKIYGGAVWVSSAISIPSGTVHYGNWVNVRN